MLCAEKRFWCWVRRRELPLFLLLAAVLGAVLRLRFVGFGTNDINCFVLPWMERLQAAGGLAGLGQPIGEYNVPYMTLLALLSYLPRQWWMYAVKGCSVLFDYLCAGAAALLAYELKKKRTVAFWVFAAALLAPHAVVNSSLWGQCDSIYTFFLVMSAWALLKKRPLLAWTLWGLAFSFKLQAVFYLPALLIYYAVNQSHTILCAMAAPAVFLAADCPAFLAGRDVGDVIGIYFRQSGLYEILTLQMPNLYSIIKGDYALLAPFGVLFTLTLLLCMAMLLFAAHQPLPARRFLLLLALCGMICTFFLPGMHERYNYPVLFLLLPLCADGPAERWAAVGLELTCFASYLPYICSIEFTAEPWMALVNFGILLFCIWRLFQREAGPLKEADAGSD